MYIPTFYTMIGAYYFCYYTLDLLVNVEVLLDLSPEGCHTEPEYAILIVF